MDQIRSGRLIAEERKKKGYTQRQLAEKLNISDKTISKWECGNGFPEVSLLLPLCDELGITVNDLLSGEIVPWEDYQKKAENNMVEMIREREANKKQFTLTLLLGGVSLAAFLTLLIVVCVYTDVIPLTVKLILLAIACVIFTVGVTAVMEGQRKIGYYQCEKVRRNLCTGFQDASARVQYGYIQKVHEVSVLPKSLVQKSDGESSEMNRRSGRNDRFHSCFFLPVSLESATNREFDAFYLSEKERNMQERMKKAVSVILVILMLGPAYGAMASGEPLFHTIREALDTSEGLAQISETDDFVTLILEWNGKYYRAVTMMDATAKELYQAAMAAGTTAVFELFDEYTWRLPISKTEEITAAAKEQTELDELAGAKVREIMDAWGCSDFIYSQETDDEPIIITLENGLFTYAFETERTGYDDMENLRVTSGKFYGFSRAAFDLTCHADGCF